MNYFLYLFCWNRRFFLENYLNPVKTHYGNKFYINLFILEAIYTKLSFNNYLRYCTSQLRLIVSAQLPAIGNTQLVEPSLIDHRDKHYDGSAKRILMSASYLLGKHSILALWVKYRKQDHKERNLKRALNVYIP